MSNSESDVFLEDVDPFSSQPTPSQTAKRKASEVGPHAKSAVGGNITKKPQTQGTLTAFFSSTGVKASSQSGTKKLKTGPGSASSTTIQNGEQQRPKLNSIPFSLSAYQQSLTDEQKDLLLLECETMGLSW